MCMIDYVDEDGGMWLVSPQRRVWDTDVHCTECRRGIQAGEAHWWCWWAYSSHDDGHPDPKGGSSQSITCSHCRAAAEWLDATCGGFVWAAICVDLEEHWDEEMIRTLGQGRLLVGMHRGWTTRAGAQISVDTVQRWVNEALTSPTISASA